jgi:hypothetical protein
MSTIFNLQAPGVRSPRWKYERCFFSWQQGLQALSRFGFLAPETYFSSKGPGRWPSGIPSNPTFPAHTQQCASPAIQEFSPPFLPGHERSRLFPQAAALVVAIQQHPQERSLKNPLQNSREEGMSELREPTLKTPTESISIRPYSKFPAIVQ